MLNKILKRDLEKIRVIHWVINSLSYLTFEVSRFFMSICNLWNSTLHQKCPYSELFWSVSSRIRTGYGELQSIFPYSIRMQENTDQNNSEYGHISNSGN